MFGLAVYGFIVALAVFALFSLHNIKFVKHPPPAGGTLFTKEGKDGMN